MGVDTQFFFVYVIGIKFVFRLFRVVIVAHNDGSCFYLHLF